MTERDDQGRFAPVKTEATPTMTADQRADAALAKIFPELASTPPPTEKDAAGVGSMVAAGEDEKTTGDGAAKEAAQTPVSDGKSEGTLAKSTRSKAHEKAIETLVLAGMKRSAAEKLDESEALEFASHRHKVDGETKAMVTRLNEFESAAKSGKPPTASAEAQQHPVSTGQGQSFVDAAKPVIEVLGLDEDAAPILDGFAKSIAKAVQESTRAEFEQTLGPVSEFAAEFVADVEASAREGLAGRFPQLNDEAQAPKIRARVEALAKTGFYKDLAPTYRGRYAKLLEDACKLEFGEPPPATTAARADAAKQNGQPITTTQTPSRGKTRAEEIDDLAMKAARLVS